MKAYMHSHRKITNWPPEPRGSYGRGYALPTAGQGKLHSGVEFVDVSFYTGPRHLLVEVEFQGRLYRGPVLAADPEDHQTLPALLNELKKQIGKDMKDISNMQFDL